MRVMSECKIHGQHLHYVRKDQTGQKRCSRCVQDGLNRYRRELKQHLVALLGGRCVKCGYSKSLWALDFHHKDIQEKTQNVSHFINQKNKKRAIEEALKCELLCRNCHAEEHEENYGRASRLVTALPC